MDRSSHGLISGTIQHLLGGTKENHKNLRQDRPFLGQDLNPKHTEYGAEVLPPGCDI
jgi:hypothetical protein